MHRGGKLTYIPLTRGSTKSTFFFFLFSSSNQKQKIKCAETFHLFADIKLSDPSSAIHTLTDPVSMFSLPLLRVRVSFNSIDRLAAQIE